MLWNVNGEAVAVENVEAVLGCIPEFLSADDPRSLAEQIDERYAHGGGWRPLAGFTFNPSSGIAQFPGDGPLQPLAFTSHNDEVLIVYRYAFCCIYNTETLAYEVARLD